MGSLNVVIAEDEVLAREKLARLIRAEPDLNLVAEATDGHAALRALATHRPDVLFLDVRMPGLSGLEVLAQAPRPPYVVFTTAYDQYAVVAFDADAVDYLLKPFGPTRFREALQRVRRRAGDGTVDTSAAEHTGSLYVVDGGTVRRIPLTDVVRFEARDDYVAVWTTGSRYLLAIRMATLEARLDPRAFVRIHRSHLVPVSRIVELTRLPGGRRRLRLDDGTAVESSRAGTRRLREVFDPS